MLTAVEYGLPTNRCGLQLRLGRERGFFRDEGVDLTLRVVFGGPEIAAQFDNGDLPIGEMGTPPGLTALAKGARFRIVGSGVRRGAVLYFVVHRRYGDWTDLAGSTLGVLSRGSCSDWYIRKILTHHGIGPDTDVTISALGPRYPDILQMLADNELDGAIMSEPHVTIGEEDGLFNVWLGMNKLDFIPPMQWTITVANNGVLAAEPDLVAAVLRGCRRSYHYAADNQDEWVDFGAHYFKISQKTMMTSIERELGDLHFDCEIDFDGLQAALDLQRDLGAVTAPLSLMDIVDSRFARLSAPRHGPEN